MQAVTTAAALGALVMLGAAPLAFPASAAPAAKAAAIDGVWKVTRAVTTGANPSTVSNPQANLYIFARGHYSTVAVTGDKARTATPQFKDPAKPTDAEKSAKFDEWAPIVAQAGTFEVNGGKLIRTPIVAKNVVAMGREGRSEVDFTLSGDTLVLISKSAPGQPAREQRLTLTRVR